MTEAAKLQLNDFIPLPFAQAYIKIPTGLKDLPCGAQLVGGLYTVFRVSRTRTAFTLLSAEPEKQ